MRRRLTIYDGGVSGELRILDANINRAREALRVMEDAARFALDDAQLCGELKSVRHDFRAAVDDLTLPGVLEANRDTRGDVGTAIATDSEMTRAGLLDVVIAAGKRLTESLRVIEEISKTLPAEGTALPGRDARASHISPASKFETLRYRAYDLDARLQLRFGAGRPRNPKLCLVLTKSLCKRPWREVLGAAIEGGCDCIQVREKDMDGGELVRHVKEVIACAKSPATADLPQTAVIVNDRVDVALAAGADGVHLGQSDLSVRAARQMAGRCLLIGVSTHDLDEARCAIEAGADYCGVGAMFATSLKPERKPSGLEYLRAFIERYPNAPHLAIGGITPANVHLVHEAGARGIAVSSAICAADDPAHVVRQLLAGSDFTAEARRSQRRERVGHLKI